MTKPIIKWVGGKTQIIHEIMEKFPPKINNYYEIFLGGGSVLLSLLENIKEKKIVLTGSIYAYDINETLIHLYKNIQKYPEEVIFETEKLAEIYKNLNGNIINRKPKNENEAKTSKESFFYWQRQQYNNFSQTDKNTPVGTAHFIFLNKTCFRGMHREGPKGFNVPFGHYKNPEIINEQQINKISLLIKDVCFICSSFEKSFENIGVYNENDFLYLDPPYLPETDKSFIGYTSSGFTIEQHNLLFNVLLNTPFQFLLSNSDSEFVKEKFDTGAYTIKIISCKRLINSKKPQSKTNEVLIYKNSFKHG